MDEIKFRFATGQDVTAIKQFLEANDLIHQDIEKELCPASAAFMAKKL